MDQVGLDYLKYLKDKRYEEVGTRIGKTIGYSSGMVGMLGVFGLSFLFAAEADISWLPGNEMNHNGYFDGEGLYKMGYFVAFGASMGLPWVLERLVGKGVGKVAPFLGRFEREDQGTLIQYNYCLGKFNSSNVESLREVYVDIMANEEFRRLPSKYQGAFKMVTLYRGLHERDFRLVKTIVNSGLSRWNEEWGFGRKVIEDYLDELSDDDRVLARKELGHLIRD